MKVLFMTNIPSPYRVDFFNELGKMCDLTVSFEGTFATDRDPKWKTDKMKNFTPLFMKGIRINSDSFFCPEIIKIIKQKWDIILVGGYSTFTSMYAIDYMRRKKIPFYIEADGGLIRNDKNLKFKLKSHYLSGATGWFSSGAVTDDYFVHYGAERSKIYRFPFTSMKKDDLVLDQVLTDEEKLVYKNKLEMKEKNVILAIGQFIYRKGFDVLLKASKNFGDDTGLYIVGGNPTEEYFDLVKEYNLKNIHFVGFKTKQELKDYYLAADMFVLPTREDIWGLVINEAMAYGLPVVTTARCVAGLELIADDEGGYIVPVDDIAALAEKCNMIINHPDLKQKMAENNLKKIQDYTIESMAAAHFEVFSNILKQD